MEDADGDGDADSDGGDKSVVERPKKKQKVSE
jgi:hypothetical protein